MKDSYYPLGDPLPTTTARWMRKKGFINNRDGIRVMARATGIHRPPCKGEWYLSGAIVHAYRALTDLGFDYHIAELVVVKVKTVEHKTLMAIIK
jgi:hypothetical protein